MTKPKMKKDWSQNETMRRIAEEYSHLYYNSTVEVSKNKVFYHWTEWSGWRFYLKAIRHGDWRSIIGHILHDHD